MSASDDLLRNLVKNWLEDPRFLHSDVVARRKIREWAEPIFGDDGTTRLMDWSVDTHNKRMVKRLSELGVSLNVDDCGDSPLASAIKNHDEEMALFLLELGSDPAEFLRNGCNALHLATKYRMHLLMERILSKGIDCNQRTLDSWQTALQIASENGDRKAETLLRKYGAR